jgi:hypothetical protein
MPSCHRPIQLTVEQLTQWTADQCERVARELEGTSQSIPSACEKLGVPEIPDPEYQLAQEQNLESCELCAWWFRSSEMVDAAEVHGPLCLECADCQ